MSSSDTSTCSRPRTSSTCTGRICARSTWPLISAYSPGSVFTGTFGDSAASTTCWRTGPEAHGMATRAPWAGAHPPRGRREGEQGLVGLPFAHEARQVGHRPEDGDTLDPRLQLRAIVVD